MLKPCEKGLICRVVAIELVYATLALKPELFSLQSNGTDLLTAENGGWLRIFNSLPHIIRSIDQVFQRRNMKWKEEQRLTTVLAKDTLSLSHTIF